MTMQIITEPSCSQPVWDWAPFGSMCIPFLCPVRDIV